MSGPNGEGLPTHVLITDELVQRALDALWEPSLDKDELRIALSTVAPELWQAGYDAGKRAPRVLPPGAEEWARIPD